MKIQIACFTKAGAALAEQVKKDLPEEVIVQNFQKSEKSSAAVTLREWAEQGFQEKNALLFVGACGIAVRSIAPYVKDKKTDPPVLVMDEKGQFVIPLLSSHLGGAGKLAERISHITGGVPVLTTASDVNHTFAVDVFAKENDLLITDMQKAKEIAAVSAAGGDVYLYYPAGDRKLAESLEELEQERIKGLHMVPCGDPGISWTAGLRKRLVPEKMEEAAAEEEMSGLEDAGVEEVLKESKDAGVEEVLKESKETGPAEKVKEPEESGEGSVIISPSAFLNHINIKQTELRGPILQLIPRNIIIGMGCRKGKAGQELLSFLMETLEELEILKEAVSCIASIDIKRAEPGLKQLAEELGVPLKVYPAEELARQEGIFSGSDFVKGKTGVDNVCERAAAAAGADIFLSRKRSRDGMTIAVGVRQAGCAGSGESVRKS